MYHINIPAKSHFSLCFFVSTEPSPVRDEVDSTKTQYDDLNQRVTDRMERLELLQEYHSLIGRLTETEEWVRNMDTEINQRRAAAHDLDSLNKEIDDMKVCMLCSNF